MRQQAKPQPVAQGPDKVVKKSLKEKVAELLAFRADEEVRRVNAEKEGEQPYYNFASAKSSDGLLQEVMIQLYQRAKDMHAEWSTEKKERNIKLPLIKQLRTRLDETRVLDDNFSPYLLKISESLRCIEDIEADKQGTSQETHLSAFDKYKVAVKFM